MNIERQLIVVFISLGLLSRVFPKNKSSSSTAMIKTVLFFIVCVILFLAQHLYLLIAYKCGWVIFSYGPIRMNELHQKKMLLEGTLLLMAVVWGYERFFRKGLFACLNKKLAWKKALWVTSFLALLLNLLIFSRYFYWSEKIFITAFFFSIMIQEMISTVIYYKTASVVLSGVIRFLFLFIPLYFFSDVEWPALTPFNYISSNPEFYILKGLSVLLFLIILLIYPKHWLKPQNLS